MSAGRSRSRDDRVGEPGAVSTGGGGGTDARVARLEAHVEILRSESSATRTDLADIRVCLAMLSERSGGTVEGLATLGNRAVTSEERIATLMERVAHLPTKGFVISTNLTALAFLSALILFAEKLRALAGL